MFFVAQVVLVLTLKATLNKDLHVFYQRPRGRYVKIGVSKSISHVIKDAKFQLYREFFAGVVWELASNISDDFNFL